MVPTCNPKIGNNDSSNNDNDANGNDTHNEHDNNDEFSLACFRCVMLCVFAIICVIIIST